MKKFLAMLLSLVLVFSMAACNNTNPTDETTSKLDNTSVQLDKYSIGLTEDGFYENFDKYEKTDFKVSDLTVDVEDVLKYVASGGEDVEVTPEDVDAYVYEYGNEVLISLGLAVNEVVEDKNYVDCTLAFYVNGEQIVDMGHTEAQTYQANAEGDEIMKSFIGHKVNDEYETSYVFPDEDTVYANQTATVKIKITAINANNPLALGRVENNAEALKEYFNNADTADNFLKELRPLIAYTLLLDWATYYFQTYKGIEAPQELVDHELYRFNCRLKSFGYTMTDYLEASKLTEAEIIEYCESLVIENIMLLTIYKQSGEELVTNDDLKAMYGDDYDYTVSMLGIPYMKLDVMREIALNHTALELNLMFNGEKYVPDEKYFKQVEIEDVNTSTNTETTTPTENTTIPTDEAVSSTEGTNNE